MWGTMTLKQDLYTTQIKTHSCGIVPHITVSAILCTCMSMCVYTCIFYLNQIWPNIMIYAPIVLFLAQIEERSLSSPGMFLRCCSLKIPRDDVVWVWHVAITYMILIAWHMLILSYLGLLMSHVYLPDIFSVLDRIPCVMFVGKPGFNKDTNRNMYFPNEPCKVIVPLTYIFWSIRIISYTNFFSLLLYVFC